MKDKKVIESQTIMTEVVMPNDTNPLNNLMGGNLMRWMDIASGVCAGKHCEAYVVTASVDHVSFTTAIKMGEVITIKASVSRAFNTSVEVYVEVFTSNMKGGESRMSNHAYFTFVAIHDETGKPIQVPQVIPLTREEQQLFDSAMRRRELRLILSGRMKPDDAKNLKLLFTN